MDDSWLNYIENLFLKAFETGQRQTSNDIINMGDAANTRHYSLSVSPFTYEHNINDGLLVTFRDLTEIIDARDQLTEAHSYINNLTDEVNKDTLTQLWNRRYVENNIFSDEKNLNAHYIALMDIDFFKAVNDTYGHDVGDLVLVFLAELTRKSFRSHDVVARWGGEEFLIILDTIDEAGAFRALESFRQKVADTDIRIGSHCFRITVTIGFSWCGNNMTFSQCVKKSDEALYHGKRNGRNTIVRYDEIRKYRIQ
jgi:diguanylate cyclase (GGDEF)-like protein